MEPHSAVYDQSRCAGSEACRLRNRSARLNVPPVIVSVDVCQGDAAGDLVERGSYAQNRLPVLPGSRVATRAEGLKQLRRSSLPLYFGTLDPADPSVPKRTGQDNIRSVHSRPLKRPRSYRILSRMTSFHSTLCLLLCSVYIPVSSAPKSVQPLQGLPHPFPLSYRHRLSSRSPHSRIRLAFKLFRFIPIPLLYSLLLFMIKCS